MQNLTLLKLNKSAKIAGFSERMSSALKRRLMELGFLESEDIKILRKSLLGKAYLIELRNYTLTIRKDIAKFVLVEG